MKDTSYNSFKLCIHYDHLLYDDHHDHDGDDQHYDNDDVGDGEGLCHTLTWAAPLVPSSLILSVAGFCLGLPGRCNFCAIFSGCFNYTFYAFEHNSFFSGCFTRQEV